MQSKPGRQPVALDLNDRCRESCLAAPSATKSTSALQPSQSPTRGAPCAAPSPPAAHAECRPWPQDGPRADDTLTESANTDFLTRDTAPIGLPLTPVRDAAAHSQRKAVSGSTRVARCAGIHAD